MSSSPAHSSNLTFKQCLVMAKTQQNKKNPCSACIYNKWKIENFCAVVARSEQEASEVNQMAGDKSRELMAHLSGFKTTE